jgi:hypothetical protein
VDHQLLLIHDSVKVLLGLSLCVIFFIVPDVDGGGNLDNNLNKYEQEANPEDDNGNSSNIIKEVVVSLKDDG